MSDPLTTTNPRRAWHDGRAAGRAEVAVILLALIAELRDCPEFPVAAATRAEARLKEITDAED